MRLHDRMNKLEERVLAPTEMIVVMDQRENEGETIEDATARYEAEHGPIYDPHGDVIRVVIQRFG